ncbi:EamA family transporter [Naasia lichenicola]|uniref:EamA family transporter n=1 Tax=Naasia lichenicola TaxID=2565933 RepID=A0A4V3WTS6_9MICO|nr:EamA family transporter [Naasia lichenicola]THG33087.1 EamA family transporter [Naasia lichenicola]
MGTKRTGRPTGRPSIAVAGPIVGALSVQSGAGVAVTILPIVGPIGVVALRQTFAALVLLPALRGKERLRWATVWPALILGLSLVVMNIAIYEAFDRIELGLAVTLEFLGPLAIALLSSRRLRDLLCGIAAGIGVALLTGSVSGLDLLGVLFALLAGVAWAVYIIFSSRVAASLEGVRGTAMASIVAAVITAPFLIGQLVRLSPDELVHVLLVGCAVGVLSSAVPYSLDVLILRRIPRSLFSVLQSIQPAAAALSGLVILHQTLAPLQLAGLAVISGANAFAVVGSTRRRPAPGPQPEPV